MNKATGTTRHAIIGVAVILSTASCGVSRARAEDLSAQVAQASDPAKRLDERLQNLDPCGDELKGMTAPGFKLACKTNLGGGTILGSTQLAWAVRNLEECASKCRPVRDCTGFAYNKEAASNGHQCYLFGGRPVATPAKSWIAGTR